MLLNIGLKYQIWNWPSQNSLRSIMFQNREFHFLSLFTQLNHDSSGLTSEHNRINSPDSWSYRCKTPLKDFCNREFKSLYSLYSFTPQFEKFTNCEFGPPWGCLSKSLGFPLLILLLVLLLLLLGLQEIDPDVPSVMLSQTIFFDTHQNEVYVKIDITCFGSDREREISQRVCKSLLKFNVCLWS